MTRSSALSGKVDKIIGMRVHEFRLTQGISRQQLAEKINVTHQQVQKYEKGTNRISAGRLASIAVALNKPLMAFFDGIDDVDNAITLPGQHHRMCIEVSRNFLRIKNSTTQNAVNNLIRNLSGN